jgi:hypothetical protein
MCALVLAAGCGSSSGPKVSNLPPTTTALAASPSTLVRGSSIQFVAAVTGTAATKPTGTVTFLSGSNTLGSAPVQADGTATLTTPLTNVSIGIDGLTASYSGDTANAPSTSEAVNVTVQAATTTAVSSSLTNIPQGLPVTLTASVARVGDSGIPTGTVTFEQGTTVVATVALSNGVAQFQLPTSALPLGAYSISAQYAGDSLDTPSASSTLTASITQSLDVLTLRDNPQRTSVQAAEQVLTPANVNTNSFGKVYSFPIDGYAYAQPLYVSGYQMNDGQLHNVLYVETAAGSVYAFDADNNNPSAGYLWKSTILGNGEQVVTQTDVNCSDTKTNIAVIGTPVIDRNLGVMYVVGKSKSVAIDGTATYYQRIHAFNLATGAEMLNGPTVIAASLPGNGANSVNGMVSFDPFLNNQRAALVEADGAVWIAWASHCDNGNYHGWVIGYNANDVSQQTAAYVTTPNGEQGGIWMSGGGISADSDGNLYVAAGNGDFDGNNGDGDYADTVQRLVYNPTASTLTLGDWFTPSDQQFLTDYDQDMGTVNNLLIDDPASGVAPHLLLAGDKTGHTYLINRDAMGGYDSGPGGVNGDIEDTAVATQVFSSFAYFNQTVYIGAGGEPLTAYPFIAGTATTAGYVGLATSESPQTFTANYSSGGIWITVSANGTQNGIVWGVDMSGKALYAYDASNLGNQLYVSTTNASRDQLPATVKMAVPTVANGHVYVGGQTVVSVYGLLGQ